MRRGPAKSNEAKPPVARKSPKSEDSKVHNLEKRLAEALGQLQTRDRELVEAREQLTAAHAQVGESHEQQTATSEILRVISSSPTSLQPVLDTIARNAALVCGATDGVVHLVEGGELPIVAHYGLVGGIEAVPIRRFPLTRGSVVGRAVIEGRTVQVEDASALDEAEFPLAKQIARQTGHRTGLATPLLREGNAIGALVIRRLEVRPFTAKQIELLKTFADQAVIAIKNVRLFNETKEALEQQTATSEILRVISSSPTDVQPVFETIARNAVNLCTALSCGVFAVDGDMLRLAATHGVPSERVRRFRQEFPTPLTGEHDAAQAVRARRVFHLADIEHNPNATATDVENARLGRYRTRLMVPMVRGDCALGLIAVTREAPTPFSERQVELLKTFADQAVIAIENVRLFTELQTSNRELTTALDTQTATSDILRVIASSPTDVQPVFDTVAESAASLCKASDTSIFRLDGDRLRRVAHHGSIPAGVIGEFTIPLVRGSFAGRCVLDGRIVHIADGQTEANEFPEGSEFARRLGFRAILLVPLLREGVAIGAITLRRTEPRLFTERQVTLLKTFADQAVIAIENVRLFTELQTRNRDLTEALDQQTATSEVLKVISRSTFDLRPVLEILIENATRLCGAQQGFLFTSDDEVHHLAVEYNAPPAFKEWVLTHPSRTGDASVVGRVAREGRVIQILDAQADAAWRARNVGAPGLSGVRSLLGVPMRREGVLIGVIAMWRTAVRPYTGKERQLVETFADQAVIAIENVRLVTELQARTQDLTRSVEQLTALGEVGRAVSSTLDLETVLSTIVSRAVQLSGLDGGVVFEYDEPTEEFVQRVATETGGTLAEVRRTTRFRKGEGVLGRTAITLESAQVPDITVPGAYESRLRENLIASGIRAILAVPMVREDRLIGCLAVTRNHPGEFAAETIELMRTFATQSALAIQNARLFREIEEKSRQLEVASQHKSEFLANMSHELRTPLNAIIGFSEVLAERMFGELNEKQEEYLKDIYASGNHLLSLINDILDLSKIEAGRMELELTDFDLPQAIDNALILVRERAGRRGIALEHSVDERLGEIRGDERKVKQVLLNLLSNALKFTPEGGRVDVRAGLVDGMAEISVTDTGVGIAPEDQGAIFEEFRQVGTAEKKAEGTGLGLTLCRKFVELHGGLIWVKSEVGAGSTFTFRIPMRSEE
jgi:GAF domain-containing protein